MYRSRRSNNVLLASVAILVLFAISNLLADPADAAPAVFATPAVSAAP